MQILRVSRTVPRSDQRDSPSVPDIIWRDATYHITGVETRLRDKSFLPKRFNV